MTSFTLSSLIQFLNTLPPEILSVGVFLCCGGGLLLTLRYFGVYGLFGYCTLALFISNIQVLKAARFSFSHEPIALGTIVFSITFLIADILTEYYSPKIALKAVWFSFLAMLVMMILMILTLGVAPLDPSQEPIEYKRFFQAHEAMRFLFLPAPAIFLASIISYVVSQVNDIVLFNFFKKATHKKFLWLRAGVSTMIASLIDTVLFSTLAWVIFAESPINLKTLLWTYILGTYGGRLLMSIANVPFVYLAGKLLPKAERYA